jgi:hypothetical protein
MEYNMKDKFKKIMKNFMVSIEFIMKIAMMKNIMISMKDSFLMI